MASALVLGFFVVLGLGVVFVAMRGGPGGARDALQARAQGGARGTVALICVVSLVFGIAVPAIVLSYNGGKQAAAGPSGSKLSGSLQKGRDLFARNCATCHTLKDARAVGKVGPNLDVLRPAAPLTLTAIAQGRARGQGQMPALLLEGADAKNVARYVAAVAGR